MKSLSNLSITIPHVFKDCARAKWHKARAFAASDEKRDIYSVLVVPDHPREHLPGIVVMARIVGETDRPLLDELLRVGIPRAQIVLTYAGEAMLEQ